MENILFKYSEFFEDDGGMLRVKADFVKLGDELIAEAKRVKKEFNSSFNLDNPELVSSYEKQIQQIVSLNNDYKKSLVELEKVEAQRKKDLKDSLSLENAIEKAKQEKLNTTKKEIQTEAELAKAIIAENNALKSSISLQNAQDAQRKKNEKSKKKEIDDYGRLSAELNKLFRASASIAVQMFELEEAGKKTSPQYAKLSAEFNTLQGRTAKLDGALKQIDASLGRNQRNVGNYANAYGSLNNAVGQLARELPAFTFSLQTGLLGISNNIGPLKDAIDGIRKQNLELAKEGKPTNSILKGLASAVFSWNTAISIGIFLLTKYTKEIEEWTLAMFGGSSALNELNERQKEYNASKTGGRKEAQTDIIELRKYLAVVKDEKVSMEERNIALKALRDQFPFYFKNLTDAQILSGQYANAERDLTKALEKRKEIEKKTELNVTNKQKIIDLNIQIDKERELLEARRATAKDLNSISGINPDVRLQGAKRVRESEIALNRLIKERNIIEKVSLKNDSDIFKLKKETIALEYQEEKQRQDKAKSLRSQQIDQVDFEASRYELEKSRLEGIIKINEEIYADETYLVEQRLAAQAQFVEDLRKLNELEKTESLRVLKKKYDEEKNETIKDNDGKILGKKYTDNGLLELEKQYQYDVQQVQETYQQKQREANKKALQAEYLERLNWQIAKLKADQKYFSKSASMYKAYNAEIAKLNEDLNQVINKQQIIDFQTAIKINEAQLNALKEFNQRIKDTFGNVPFEQLTESQKKRYLEFVKAFEQEKTDIEANYARQRKIDRLHNIEQQMSDLRNAGAEETNEFRQLMLEKQSIEIDIEKETTEMLLKSSKEKWKNFAKELNDIVGQIIDRLIAITQSRIEEDQRLLDKQRDAVETQERRAEAGLDNTLAYEKKIQAEREASLIKQQKREERLQKIKALWTSYTSYADKEKDTGTAIAKALRDFAILESVSAAFGDGGIVEDRLPTNGIFRGQSHNGNNGGIPILVEGKEGIFSANEMANLGKDNFYRMKELAGMGKIDKNFFSGQRQQFVQSIVPVNTGHSPELLSEMKNVKKAIENKPVQNWKAEQIANGVLNLVEETISSNKVTRNHYRVRKPRI